MIEQRIRDLERSVAMGDAEALAALIEARLRAGADFEWIRLARRFGNDKLAARLLEERGVSQRVMPFDGDGYSWLRAGARAIGQCAIAVTGLALIEAMLSSTNGATRKRYADIADLFRLEIGYYLAGDVNAPARLSRSLRKQIQNPWASFLPDPGRIETRAGRLELLFWELPSCLVMRDRIFTGMVYTLQSFRDFSAKDTAKIARRALADYIWGNFHSMEQVEDVRSSFPLV